MERFRGSTRADSYFRGAIFPRTQGCVKGSAAEGKFRKCGLTFCVFQVVTQQNKARACGKALDSKQPCSNWPVDMDPEYPDGHTGKLPNSPVPRILATWIDTMVTMI